MSHNLSFSCSRQNARSFFFNLCTLYVTLICIVLNVIDFELITFNFMDKFNIYESVDLHPIKYTMYIYRN